MLWLRPCSRRLKTFPDRKNQASYADFPIHAGIILVTEKNPDYYLLSSQVLLYPKLGSLKLKFCFVQN